MYYSSGNYEAFARPKKPEGVDHKSAYIVGSGLAALTAACYLVRDGKKITDMDLPLIPRLALKEALKKIEGTDLEKILKEYNAI